MFIVLLHLTENASWANTNSGAYSFFDNNSKNKTKYGALYNWYAVNTGKLAPKGWHVPTDDEWTILGNYLISNGYNWDGTTTGNKIAKAMADKSAWAPGYNNDTTTNNKSGFSALPGGYRYDEGPFYSRGTYVMWWTSTLHPSGALAYRRHIWIYTDYLERNASRVKFGHYIRLVKD